MSPGDATQNLRWITFRRPEPVLGPATTKPAFLHDVEDRRIVEVVGGVVRARNHRKRIELEQHSPKLRIVDVRGGHESLGIRRIGGMTGDGPPGRLEEFRLIERHRAEQRRDERPHGAIGLLDRGRDRPRIDLVDESLEVRVVHRAADRKSPKFELPGSLSGFRDRELPQRLAVLAEHEVDESSGEFPIRRSGEHGDGIRVDDRLAGRVDVPDPPDRVGARESRANRRIPGPLRLVPSVEVDAYRRRGLPCRDFDRSLGAAPCEGACVRRESSEDPPAVVPTASLEDRLEGGGHGAAHPRIDHRDPAFVFRHGEILPGSRRLHPELIEHVSVEDDPEARHRGAEPAMPGVEERLVGDPTIAVDRGEPGVGDVDLREDRRLAVLPVDPDPERLRELRELIAAAAPEEVGVAARFQPAVKRRRVFGDEEFPNLARATRRAPDDLDRRVEVRLVPLLEGVLELPANLFVVRRDDDEPRRVRIDRLSLRFEDERARQQDDEKQDGKVPKHQFPASIASPTIPRISPAKSTAAVFTAACQSPGRSTNAWMIERLAVTSTPLP